MTWADIWRIGVGQVGLQPSELENLQLKEFFWILEGFNRRKETENLESWSLVRWVVAQLVNISGKSVKKNIQPTDLFKFDFEQVKPDPDAPKMDEKRYKEILDSWDKDEQQWQQ